MLWMIFDYLRYPITALEMSPPRLILIVESGGVGLALIAVPSTRGDMI